MSDHAGERMAPDEARRGGAGERRILLVSPDLLSTSRLAGLARAVPARLETLRSLDDPVPAGPFDLVLLDTHAVPGDPAVSVARLRAIAERQRAEHGRAPRVVAFGPHVAKQRLDDARAAGADDAISRGELLGGFPAVVKRWCG
jgi:CheY-like chemotaxis protein